MRDKQPVELLFRIPIRLNSFVLVLKISMNKRFVLSILDFDRCLLSVLIFFSTFAARKGDLWRSISIY